MKRLSKAQRRVLLQLSEPNEDGYRVVRGRGPIASAECLGIQGLAEKIGIGWWSGQMWKATPAGLVLARELKREDAES